MFLTEEAGFAKEPLLPLGLLVKNLLFLLKRPPHLLFLKFLLERKDSTAFSLYDPI